MITEQVLELANRVEEFRKVNPWLEEIWRENELPEEWMFDVEVALEELIANTISYGYKEEAEEGEVIRVEFRLRKRGVEVEVIDHAAPFDPTQAPPPDLESPLADRPIGGLGIHMVRELMDHVEYHRRNDHNHVLLCKRFPDQ